MRAAVHEVQLGHWERYIGNAVRSCGGRGGCPNGTGREGQCEKGQNGAKQGGISEGLVCLHIISSLPGLADLHGVAQTSNS